jgi:hypothetical protein
MNLRNRFKEPKFMFRVGAAGLLLANLSRWFLHPAADFSQGLVDGATGMLFGLAIGLMLVAVRLYSQQNCSGGGSACSS